MIHSNKNKKAFVQRCLAVLPSVPLCALGIVFFLKADWGSDPLVMLEVALSKHLHISLGGMSLIFEGSIFIIFFFLNRKLVNVGSFMYAFGLGPCIDFFTPVVDQLVPVAQSITVKAICLSFGVFFICFALAYYIPIDFGYQTSDILTLTIQEKSQLNYGSSLTLVYSALFVCALLLGGSWGIGTLVALFLFGPIIDKMMCYTRKFSARFLYVEESTVY